MVKLKYRQSEGVKNKVVRVRITDAEMDLLRSRAAGEGITVSKYIANLIFNDTVVKQALDETPHPKLLVEPLTPWMPAPPIDDNEEK